MPRNKKSKLLGLKGKNKRTIQIVSLLYRSIAYLRTRVFKSKIVGLFSISGEANAEKPSRVSDMLRRSIFERRWGWRRRREEFVPFSRSERGSWDISASHCKIYSRLSPSPRFLPISAFQLSVFVCLFMHMPPVFLTICERGLRSHGVMEGRGSFHRQLVYSTFSREKLFLGLFVCLIY